MSREVMQQALDAMTGSYTNHDEMNAWHSQFQAAIKALSGALTQPEQEPFGYFKAEPFGWTDCAETDDGAKALYEAPPQPAPIPVQADGTPEVAATKAAMDKLARDAGIPPYTHLLQIVAKKSPQPAQPEQEPVAWLHPANATCVTTDPTAYARGIPLYTAPPAAQKPLTDEQIDSIVREAGKGSALRRDGSTSHRIARAIEAAHGIKENP